MKERPILFSGPMVRAILEGRKTQTRRAVKCPPWSGADNWKDAELEIGPHGPETICDETGCLAQIANPYGVPGDRLWVRETYCIEDNTEYYGDPEFAPPKDGRPIQHHKPLDEYDSLHDLIPRYRATEPDTALCCEHEKCEGGPCLHPWHPSIFMPRWASRIILEITDVRVQRVQDINGADAICEGIKPLDTAAGFVFSAGRYEYFTPEDAFHALWDSINAKRGFGWATNPWVWAITFKRVTA